LWSAREINFGKPSFKLSLTRVFQSVGLAPLMTQSNPAGLFATYRDPSSPFQFRRDHFKNDKMTKMEKLKEVTELQTFGGLLLDIEFRNGMDDLSYMIAEEIPIEMEEGVDEESSEELKELVGDENDDRLISEEVPEESEGLREDEVVDHALIGEKSSSLDEVL
jgi:hypothetical protein